MSTQKYRLAHKSRNTVKPRCSECKRISGVKLAYRLDPVNWRPVHKLLCQPCRTRLGYAVVSYGRLAPRLSGFTYEPPR